MYLLESTICRNCLLNELPYYNFFLRPEWSLNASFYTSANDLLMFPRIAELRVQFLRMQFSVTQQMFLVE